MSAIKHEQESILTKSSEQVTSGVLLLGVNIDHVATLRQARGTTYPSPFLAAELAKSGGADGITIHLREDRRHIVDQDVVDLCRSNILPINLEMAATTEMLEIALENKPTECCLVPEKRQELTTEGGLDVVANKDELYEFVQTLRSAGIKVSLFIDPDERQIEASKVVGADIVEIHTGTYSDCLDTHQSAELKRIQLAAKFARNLGLVVNAGHGLRLDNVSAIAAIPEMYCLNIGHSIVAQAVFVGLERAVSDMKGAMFNQG